MKGKNLTARIRPKNRQEKNRTKEGKKVSPKPIPNSRIRRKSGAR